MPSSSELAADSPLFSLRGSRLFRRASEARYYRSARGLEDLIRCDDKVYIYSDAATMFASINDRLPATVVVMEDMGKVIRRRQARLNRGLSIGGSITKFMLSRPTT